MTTFCYNCGAKTNDQKFCSYCGTDTQPPEDVYFVEEDCGDCDARLPRWANFCPECGRKFGFIPPNDPKRVAKRNKGLVAGAIFFTVISFAIAMVIFAAEDTVKIEYTLIPAAGFALIIWLVTAIRWERGKFVDGTVVRHYSEERTTSRRDINNTTMTGKARRIDEHFTLYSTDVLLDNGRTERFDIQCAANHIQLQPGERIRYYLSTRTYRKL
ncbi:MAG: zinc ribbon domain-containing protein [Eubacteriales bacterium]|nr:zinc ribbon domain-containing protein [Eubacteriales bacterium]MDD4327323.1 zinc ribbon domain-containing protein [Eubacteriales bacterium]MDD4717022.1 zinc ribbon domain-containing protein [Eubacteriales bacterium]